MISHHILEHCQWVARNRARLFVSALFAAILGSCGEQSEVDFPEHDAEYILNWTCESIARDYREDRDANPDLCKGYDENGWPVEGKEIQLPETWRKTDAEA